MASTREFKLGLMVPAGDTGYGNEAFLTLFRYFLNFHTFVFYFLL